MVPEAVEAELFGQVRGGPHAARQDKPGKLELALASSLYASGGSGSISKLAVEGEGGVMLM